jgi:hypothetical protein
MRNIYFKILISIVIFLWIVYFIQYYYKIETFTPRINSIYNPTVRKINNIYEKFMNPIKEIPKTIINKIYKYKYL